MADTSSSSSTPEASMSDGQGPARPVPPGVASRTRGQSMPATGTGTGTAAGATARYRMTAWRAACGVCWAGWTVVLAVAAVITVASGNIAGFLACAVLAGLAGWYDYRIWSCQARRLTLFIIF
jgi:hypothetical protein